MRKSLIFSLLKGPAHPCTEMVCCGGGGSEGEGEVSRSTVLSVVCLK